MPVHYGIGSFPPESLDWQVLIPLLGATAAAVARYDGALAAVPNPDVLLAPCSMEEATFVPIGGGPTGRSHRHLGALRAR